MKLKFEKVLGSKIDGRGGQLFFATYRTGNKLFPSYHLFSFYVRADDGLRDCWAELEMPHANHKKFLEEIMSFSGGLPVFDISFEYLKQRVNEGIKYKKKRGWPLPEEFSRCAPLLDCEAVNDLSWKKPPFFSKTIKEYISRFSKKNFIQKVDETVMEMMPEMFLLGWGLNDEDMDAVWPDISKIEYDPYDTFMKMKIFGRSGLDAEARRNGDLFDDLIRKLFKRTITVRKVREWEKKAMDASCFCYNVGEKKLAEQIHFISLSLQLVPSRIAALEHPFLHMLMLISILAAMKRHDMASFDVKEDF